MKEIKFRVWDKKNNKMWQWSNIFRLGSYGNDNINYCKIAYSDIEEGIREFELHKNEFILMQYTCLKDKNGKEIYEGDIVKIYNPIDKIYYIGEIKFGRKNLSFNVKIKYKSDKATITELVPIHNFVLYGLLSIDEVHYDIEIIGNIYEDNLKNYNNV